MRLGCRLSCAALVLALCGSLLGCGAADSSDESAWRLGVLLPYTGDDAATGASLERGVLMAYRAYEAGGGSEISLVFRDATDDPEQAKHSAEELADEGVVGVIGPGGDSLAGPVLSVLTERGIPLVSPVATTARTQAYDEERPWLRVSVPGNILARSLANLLLERKVRSVQVVTASDVFHRDFSQAFIDRAKTLDIAVSATYTIDERQLSFGSVVGDLIRADEDAGILLAMNPLPAARLINDVAVSSPRKHHWFLSPRLKSEVFLLNTIPSELEGAIGVSPDTLLNEVEFGERFAGEWDGDSPLDGAHFSYDAAAVALAAFDRIRHMQQEVREATVNETSTRLPGTILELAAFGGSIVGWKDLRRGLELNAAERAWQYSGVTGPIVFAPDGSRRSGSIEAWGIEQNEIVGLE